MEDLVTLENVTRRFPMDHQFVTAVDGVSLRFTAGSFVAIAGPSGSGKSTLLHLIGCIDVPDRGTLRIAGQDTARLNARELACLRRRSIGFVFQTFNLIPVFTALENVEYPLLLVRMSAGERRRRAMEALASVGLADRAGQRPDLLSGGQRQRVAVARAIVHRPALVLADEPTANLDTANATQLVDLMRGLNSRLGLTFLFATHDPRLVERAGWVVRLCDGRVETEVQRENVSAARL
ncbi:MAG TPA: ABC transporter ATP-binding protein [Bryobacteraceae bacterium]|nr:ABC transporter ATP-binding protein [Bryobacteraceae bacterium]